MPFVPDQQQQPAGGRFVPDTQEPPRSRARALMSQIGVDVKHGLGRTARMGAETVAALPLMAADFGVAVRNLGENVVAGRPPLGLTRELPSQQYARGLDQLGLPRPKGVVERVGDVVGQAVLGARLPVPSAGGNQVPANFNAATQRTLENANRAGYVIPPATARPRSTAASMAEGAAGKLSTGQLASSMNQRVTNRLAGQAVGIMDDGTVSREALQTIRAEAGKAHEALRSFPGQLVSDTRFRVELADAVKSFSNTAAQIPALAQDDVLAIAKGLEQPRFDPGVAVDAISLLRDRADIAYRSGDRTLGRAYRGLSDAFEGLVERRIVASGPQGAGLISEFRNARQLIAKTYSIENALRGQNVDAQALARTLDKGKYLSGTLRQIAEFAQKFPKAARVTPATESLPMYSPLDYLAMGASTAAAGTTGDLRALIPALYAGGRPLLRNFLLSPAGQSLVVNGIPQNALGAAAGAAPPVINALRREPQE